MKTLIYTLSTPKCGTTRLYYALKTTGLDSNHEIIDIRPIYLKWMKKRFTSNPSINTTEAKEIWKNELLKYLKDKTEGYFADISHYLSTLYPVVESIAKDNGIETRCIHLTRNYFPHNARRYGWFSDTKIRIHDNIKHEHRDMYYPAELTWSSNITWDEWVSMSQFERICHYWKLHNEYFLKANLKIFNVENFNNQASEILNELYPEATNQQKDKFKEALHFIPNPPEKKNPPYSLKMTNEEEEIYNRVCGPTLKKLGYIE